VRRRCSSHPLDPACIARERAAKQERAGRIALDAVTAEISAARADLLLVAGFQPGRIHRYGVGIAEFWSERLV
jgi:hypothetical protein